MCVCVCERERIIRVIIRGYYLSFGPSGALDASLSHMLTELAMLITLMMMIIIMVIISLMLVMMVHGGLRRLSGMNRRLR